MRRNLLFRGGGEEKYEVRPYIKLSNKYENPWTLIVSITFSLYKITVDGEGNIIKEESVSLRTSIYPIQETFQCLNSNGQSVSAYRSGVVLTVHITGIGAWDTKSLPVEGVVTTVVSDLGDKQFQVPFTIPGYLLSLY